MGHQFFSGVNTSDRPLNQKWPSSTFPVPPSGHIILFYHSNSYLTRTFTTLHLSVYCHPHTCKGSLWHSLTAIFLALWTVPSYSTLIVPAEWMNDLGFIAFKLVTFCSFQYECKGIPSGPRNTVSSLPTWASLLFGPQTDRERDVHIIIFMSTSKKLTSFNIKHYKSRF